MKKLYKKISESFKRKKSDVDKNVTNKITSDKAEKETKEKIEKEKEKAKNAKRKSLLTSLYENYKLLIMLVRDYKNGIYTDIGREEITLIIVCIAYVMNPFDFIPDTIAGLGLLDDAFALKFVISSIKDEIELYKKWKYKD